MVALVEFTFNVISVVDVLPDVYVTEFTLLMVATLTASPPPNATVYTFKPFNSIGKLVSSPFNLTFVSPF